eukprot:g75642.t1
MAGPCISQRKAFPPKLDFYERAAILPWLPLSPIWHASLTNFRLINPQMLHQPVCKILRSDSFVESNITRTITDTQLEEYGKEQAAEMRKPHKTTENIALGPMSSTQDNTGVLVPAVPSSSPSPSPSLPAANCQRNAHKLSQLSRRKSSPQISLRTSPLPRISSPTFLPASRRNKSNPPSPSKASCSSPSSACSSPRVRSPPTRWFVSRGGSASTCSTVQSTPRENSPLTPSPQQTPKTPGAFRFVTRSRSMPRSKECERSPVVTPRVREQHSPLMMPFPPPSQSNSRRNSLVTNQLSRIFFAEKMDRITPMRPEFSLTSSPNATRANSPRTSSAVHSPRTSSASTIADHPHTVTTSTRTSYAPTPRDSLEAMVRDSYNIAYPSSPSLPSLPSYPPSPRLSASPSPCEPPFGRSTSSPGSSSMNPRLSFHKSISLPGLLSPRTSLDAAKRVWFKDEEKDKEKDKALAPTVAVEEVEYLQPLDPEDDRSEEKKTHSRHKRSGSLSLSQEIKAPAEPEKYTLQLGSNNYTRPLAGPAVLFSRDRRPSLTDLIIPGKAKVLDVPDLPAYLRPPSED